MTQHSHFCIVRLTKQSPRVIAVTGGTAPKRRRFRMQQQVYIAWEEAGDFYWSHLPILANEWAVKVCGGPGAAA